MADGATALWLAAFTGAADAVKVLLAAGANREAEAECRAVHPDPRESKCPVARIAELRGNEKVVQALAETATPR